MQSWRWALAERCCCTFLCLTHLTSTLPQTTKIFQRVPVKVCRKAFRSRPKASPPRLLGSFGRKVTEKSAAFAVTAAAVDFCSFWLCSLYCCFFAATSHHLLQRKQKLRQRKRFKVSKQTVGLASMSNIRGKCIKIGVNPLAPLTLLSSSKMN